MMGRVVLDPWEPVTKRTSGVIVLPPDHPVVRRKLAAMEQEVRLARTVCCQCRLCTDLCPRHLLGHDINPHLAMRSLGTDGLFEVPSAHITAAFLCCLCGVCEVMACPLMLSPRKVFDNLRGELARAGLPNPHRRQDVQPREFQHLRRIPLPRLTSRLGLAEYQEAPDEVDLRIPRVSEVRILLSQHTGAPSRPVVSPGETVTQGQVIAEIPEGKLGARQHASIDGIVTRVDSHDIRIQAQ